MKGSRRVLVALAVLAACSAEGSGEAGGDRGTDSTAARAPTGDAAARPSAPYSGRSRVVLLPGGVEIAADAGAAKRIAFGTGQRQVVADVSAALGRRGEEGVQQECPAGPLSFVTYDAGLQLVFQDGAFVGWSARAGSRLRTAQGIGPGSTVAALKVAYPSATLEETSLGMEFMAGGLYGVVTDSAAAGVVEILFAGTGCIFR